MSEFYQGLQTDAAALITEFGTTGTLKRKTTMTPDPAKPHVVVPGEVSHNIVLVAAEYELRDIDNTVVLSGDRRLFVGAESLEAQEAGPPEPNDEIEYGGETLTVVRVSPVSPAGTAVVYDVQVRA